MSHCVRWPWQSVSDSVTRVLYTCCFHIIVDDSVSLDTHPHSPTHLGSVCDQPAAPASTQDGTGRDSRADKPVDERSACHVSVLKPCAGRCNEPSDCSESPAN